MSAERDAGLQALQQGNSIEAVSLLETACQQDPGDFDAHLFLAAAYGQAGKRMEAINAVTHAVQLQPANAQARYNLGVAMEQGGYREQAITALGQALTLQPDYPKAQEALRRLQGDSAAGANTGAPMSGAAPAAAAYPTDEPAASSAAGPTGYNEGAPSYGASAPASYGGSDAAPAGESSSLPQFGFGQYGDSSNAPAASPYGQPPNYAPPTQGAEGYSAAPPPRTAEPLFGAPLSQPPESGGYGQEQAPSSYAAPAPAQYGAPSPSPDAAPAPYSPPPYGSLAPGPYGGQGVYGQGQYQGQPVRRNQDYVDSFDIVEAARNWVQVIAKPAQFFNDQAGKTGILAPFTLSLMYVVAVVAGFMIGGATISLMFKDVPAIGAILAGGGIIYFLIFAVPVLYIDSFLFAWIVHGIGCLFGNKASYSASYRAVMYSIAPQPLVFLLCSPVWWVPGLFWLFFFASGIWAFVLLVVAISSVQEMPAGSAFGVAALSVICRLAIQFGLGILLFLILAAIGFAAASGAR